MFEFYQSNKTILKQIFNEFHVVIHIYQWNIYEPVHCAIVDFDLENYRSMTVDWLSKSTPVLDDCIHQNDFVSHGVESPSMIDPQWNIWYWGSKWNLHTVCWGAVGCEWGTTSVYFGVNYVCFIPSRLPVFAVEPQYRLQDFFILVKSIIWRTRTESSQNFMLF